MDWPHWRKHARPCHLTSMRSYSSRYRTWPLRWCAPPELRARNHAVRSRIALVGWAVVEYHHGPAFRHSEPGLWLPQFSVFSWALRFCGEAGTSTTPGKLSTTLLLCWADWPAARGSRSPPFLVQSRAIPATTKAPEKRS